MSAPVGFRFLHTTEVPVSTTASQMMAILGLMGATNISMQMESGEPCGMTFQTQLGTNFVSYKIPVNWKNIYTDMINIDNKKRTSWRTSRADRESKSMAQAKRTAWRLALEWLKVQCAFVQNGVKSAGEVFLSDMIVPNGDGKTTIGEALLEGGQLAKLTGGL